MRVLIINSAEAGITRYVETLEEIVKALCFSYQVIEYKSIPEIDIKKFDAILISGSPRGNDIVEHHLPYFQKLYAEDIPILGICAGHHITGKNFGSEVIRGKEAENGYNKVQIIKDDALFSGYVDKEFYALQNHNDAITLPNEFLLLCTSGNCNNALMKHKEKMIYTSQFHPEYLNKKLIVNFLTIVMKGK